MPRLSHSLASEGPEAEPTDGPDLIRGSTEGRPEPRWLPPRSGDPRGIQREHPPRMVSEPGGAFLVLLSHRKHTQLAGTTQRGGQTPRRSPEESIQHLRRSRGARGSLRPIGMWSRGQTPSSTPEEHEARGQCQARACSPGEKPLHAASLGSTSLAPASRIYLALFLSQGAYTYAHVCFYPPFVVF